LKRILLALVLGALGAWGQEQQQHQQQQQHGAPAPAAGETHHKSSSKGGGHHEPDATTTLWKWIDFGILVVLLGWGLTKAGPFFRERGEQIRKSLDEAKQVRAEAEARAAELTRRLGNLDTELAGLRAAAKHEMEAESKRIREETLKLAARIDEQAQLEVASMTKAAESSLKAEAARLALQLAEQKVRDRMTADVRGSLVSRFVSGLRNTVNS
jgi:F-type H+-transporting ATPase subunit b